MNQTLLVALAFASLSVLIQASDLCDQYPESVGCANIQKRKSSYMRFGRSAPDFDESVLSMVKRKSAYMRFGKRSAGDVVEFAEEIPQRQVRKSAYMRFGKRSAEPLVEFVPVEEPAYYMEKRKPASIRFG